MIANIRGGGEYGPAWHQAAQKEKRHKAYEDVEAVAQDLIARRVSSPSKLAVIGGSNGGVWAEVCGWRCEGGVVAASLPTYMHSLSPYLSRYLPPSLPPSTLELLLFVPVGRLVGRPAGGQFDRGRADTHSHSRTDARTQA